MKEATSPSGTQTMPQCHPSSEVYSVSLLLNTDEGRFPGTTLNHELHLGGPGRSCPALPLPGELVMAGREEGSSPPWPAVRARPLA